MLGISFSLFFFFFYLSWKPCEKNLIPHFTNQQKDLGEVPAYDFPASKGWSHLLPRAKHLLSQDELEIVIQTIYISPVICFILLGLKAAAYLFHSIGEFNHHARIFKSFS